MRELQLRAVHLKKCYLAPVFCTCSDLFFSLLSNDWLAGKRYKLYLGEITISLHKIWQ